MRAYQKQFTKQYEYITVVPAFMKNKKMPVSTVYNTKRRINLGIIIYSGAWRQFIFLPADSKQFSVGCLNDISSYIKELSGDYIGQMRDAFDKETGSKEDNKTPEQL